MPYLGKVELKSSNIKRWTGVPGAVSAITYSTLGFIPFNEPSTFITVNGVGQHDSAFALGSSQITFSSAFDVLDEVEVTCIIDVGQPISVADDTVGITQLKVSDGTVGQVLTTDGSGALSFSSKSTETLVSLGVTSTSAELNILDGVTSTAAELNILDGVTSTAAELNILDGVTSTSAELNILDGVTSTAAELNILDGVTSTAAELNILDGVTSTAAELNILDGVTASTTEFNYVDGVTSLIQDQIDAKVDDTQVLTDVPSGALFTDTIYTHPNHSGDVVSVGDGATTIQAGAVDIAMLSATGTASGTTFLRGDNTWVTPTDTNTDTKWDGGTTGLTASTGRTSLGLDIGTDVQAYDSDTSKTDVAETRSASINMADNILQRPELKDYSETKVAMGANDVDLTAGNVSTKTISGTTTLTFSSPPASGKAGAFTLILTNGGSATVTFINSSGTVKWAAATPPALTAAGVDVLTFTTINGGTTWYGIASGIGMA